MTDDNTTPRYAARIRALGLTTYGLTSEEAGHKLAKMLWVAVQARQANGTLVEWLHRAGLVSTLEKYDGQKWEVLQADARQKLHDGNDVPHVHVWKSDGITQDFWLRGVRLRECSCGVKQWSSEPFTGEWQAL